MFHPSRKRGMERQSLRRIALVLTAMCVSSCATAPTTRGAAKSFDSIFDDVFSHYHLPGLALGVVQDGTVIYQRTAGEVIAGSGQPITPNSLFKIASNSKAMTTALLARLVDQGKLRWDDPVVRHLPQFKMGDPWITREMQVRDLLIHNSGLREGAGDLMLWPEPNAFTREDIISGLAHLRPAKSFRSEYAYDNLLYVVAGEVAAAAGGASYEELIRRELFSPLNMTRCQSGAFDRAQVNDVAQPHTPREGVNVVIRADEARVPTTTSAAAGGIRCGLNDMLTWISVWLADEMRDGNGQRWLSDDQRKALWSAHTPMPISDRQRRWDGSRFNAYGYGWRLSDVDGVLRVAHTGTLAGMFSAVTLLPEKKIGFVFMINGDAGEARTVLSQLLTKHFTAPDDRRTLADLVREIASESSSVPLSEKAPDVSVRRAATRSEFESYLGVYEDPWFGRVDVCPASDRIEFRSHKSPLLAGTVVISSGKLLVDWHEVSVDAEAWLTFAPRDSLTMMKVDPQADFSFDFEDLHFARVAACP
ncbi:MAG TPA: serine hydrolase domain-containing protein [Steroidobacteraceae bacterium]|nr:serine hydrolase domain-containing protein [Steroidobacteraceae bacterium]